LFNIYKLIKSSFSDKQNFTNREIAKVTGGVRIVSACSTLPAPASLGNQEIQQNKKRIATTINLPQLQNRPNKTTPKAKTVGNDLTLIPLHVGSDIFISKQDVMNVWTMKPALYVVRLAKVVFGESAFNEAAKKFDGELDGLDQKKLKAIQG
jgi:hypothetical protein